MAMGVLGTMFGGIALLSGGSSKAVQQSPPIKASSRGEEDFIQYVSNALWVHRDARCQPSGKLQDRTMS